MIKSKKLQKFKNINHGFFNSTGGISSGIYKSLNCGMGSNDKKKNVIGNLKIVSKKIGLKNRFDTEESKNIKDFVTSIQDSVKSLAK